MEHLPDTSEDQNARYTPRHSAATPWSASFSVSRLSMWRSVRCISASATAPYRSTSGRARERRAGVWCCDWPARGRSPEAEVGKPRGRSSAAAHPGPAKAGPLEHHVTHVSRMAHSTHVTHDTHMPHMTHVPRMTHMPRIMSHISHSAWSVVGRKARKKIDPPPPKKNNQAAMHLGRNDGLGLSATTYHCGTLRISRQLVHFIPVHTIIDMTPRWGGGSLPLF